MRYAAGPVRIEGFGPELVLLHGGPGLSASSVEAVSRLLCRSFTVVRYDQLGTAAATAAGIRLSVHALVEQIEEVRRSMQTGTVALLGHSWGAALAALYAYAYPEHVAAISMVHPMELASRYLEVSETEIEKRRPWKSRQHTWHIRARLKQLAYNAPEREALEWEQHLLDLRLTCADAPDGSVLDTLPPSRFDSEAAEIIWADLETQWPDSESEGYDLSPVMKQIQVPVQVIVGENDVIDGQSAERLATLTRARLTQVPHCGHWSFLEQPEAFEKSVSDFLRQWLREDFRSWKVPMRDAIRPKAAAASN